MSLQSIEQTSLCYTVGPYLLPILYIVVCICQSQSPTFSLPPFPPCNPKFLHLWLYFCFVNKFICTHFLDSTYKWYHMVFLFLWLTSLSLTISRSIHVAANGIILFFLWLSNILLYICTHPLYPFLCWWTFRLLPCPGYCK